MTSRAPAPEQDGHEIVAVYEEHDLSTGTVAEISDPDNPDAWIRSDRVESIEA